MWAVAEVAMQKTSPNASSHMALKCSVNSTKSSRFRGVECQLTSLESAHSWTNHDKSIYKCMMCYVIYTYRICAYIVHD